MILSILIIIFSCLCFSDSFLQVKFPSARLNPKVAIHMSGRMPYVPYYPSKHSKDYQWMDIYNALGRERTLFVSRFIDEEASNQLIASLIWLQG